MCEKYTLHLPILISITLITLTGGISISAMESSDVIFIEDAVKCAQQAGLSSELLPSLRDTLRQSANISKEEYPIDRRVAYNLIEKALIAQISGKKIAVPQSLVPFKLEDVLDIQSPIHRGFEQARKAVVGAQGRIQGLLQSGKDPFEAAMAKENLENNLTAALRKSSTSEWYYTGDLLWRYLFIRNFLPLIKVSSIHGPLFTQLDDKAHLYHSSG